MKEMTQITLRLPADTLKKVQLLASQKNLTVTDYVLSKVDPDYEKTMNILRVDDILRKLDSIPKGETFSLRSLYEKDQWLAFSIGSRISTGRLFFQSYDKDLYNLKNRIEFIGKDSANLAEYKKLKDN